MKKFALVAAVLVASVAIVAEAQIRRNSRVPLGSPDTNVILNGALEVGAPLYPVNTTLGVIVDGGLTVTGTVVINSTLTTKGAVTGAGTYSPAVIDAGSVLVRADEQVVGILTVGGTSNVAGLDAGTALFRADVQFAGAVIPTSTTVVGDITLNGGSPATATATVRSGAKCVCTLVGTSAASAAKGVACNVSSTTLTATSANAANEHVQYICF